MGQPKRVRGANHCPTICRAKRCCSTSTRQPVRSVAADCIRSVKASARCSTGFRLRSVSCAFAARNTPAAPVARCTKRRHRNVRSRLGWRHRRCLRRLIAKYCDRLPLYRQAQIFCRHGVEIERSTLAGWVGGTCWWLDAPRNKLCAKVFASNHLFGDDTPIPVSDPGRNRTKSDRLWVYARDDRPWGGPAPPAGVFLFEPDRSAERPKTHLERFKGVLSQYRA